MLYEYQLKIADLYNIPIGNVKKLVPNFFDKEKYVLHYENLQLYCRLGLKIKKYIAYKNSMNHNGWIQHKQKNAEAETNWNNGGKELYKLMKNAIYGKMMENVRNRIDVNLANNEKG